MNNSILPLIGRWSIQFIVQDHLFLERSHALGHKSKLAQLLFRGMKCYLLQISDYDKFHVILLDAQ